MPEFGLGDSPDADKIAKCPKGMTAHKAQIEEEHASVLGIYWERELGLDWYKTFQNHSWDWETPVGLNKEESIFNFNAKHKFAKRLQELRRRQII